jgi:hypothetical protein
MFETLTPVTNNFSVIGFVAKLLCFDINIQFGISEMLGEFIISKPFRALNFIQHFLTNQFKVQKLSDAWKKDFLSRASEFPFFQALQQCYPKSSSIEDITDKLKSFISEATNNAYIVDNSPGVAGLTFKHRCIFLRSHAAEPLCAKGATFYSFLHELAHLAQRAACNTYGEAAKNISEEVTITFYDEEYSSIASKNKEGREMFEMAVFGDLPDFIREKGERFLFLDSLTVTSIQDFQERFKLCNSKSANAKQGTQIYFMDSTGTPIGECLFPSLTYNRNN